MKVGMAAAIALIGMSGSGGAMAADAKFDGNELLAQCQQYLKAADSESNYDRIDAGLCTGFLQGVLGAFTFLREELENDSKFCVPNGVTNVQTARIVVKYLKDNPKLLNLNRTGLVWSALKDAYPCN